MFATVSLFSYCGLRSLLQLICTLHVSHSSCYFVCCSDMLSHLSHISFIVLMAIILGLMKSGLLFLRRVLLPNLQLCPVSIVLHVSVHCHTDYVLDKHGVAKVSVKMLSVALCWAITSPDGCWKATVCCMLSCSVCRAHGSWRGWSQARLQHGGQLKKPALQLLSA